MIGIYDGTFDPVHYGHLRTALEVSECFSLDELRLIPCSRPPHRAAPMATAQKRLQMLRLAVTNDPVFVIDKRELIREGPSYMVDTLESIREEVPEVPLLLFIGADGFRCLTCWFQWERLFDFAHIVVMSRPGAKYNASKENNFLKNRCTDSISELKAKSCGALFFQNVTPLDISATQIRHIIASNRNPEFLLPDSVVEFIRLNKLYLTTA